MKLSHIDYTTRYPTIVLNKATLSPLPFIHFADAHYNHMINLLLIILHLQVWNQPSAYKSVTHQRGLRLTSHLNHSHCSTQPFFISYHIIATNKQWTDQADTLRRQPTPPRVRRPITQAIPLFRLRHSPPSPITTRPTTPTTPTLRHLTPTTTTTTINTLPPLTTSPLPHRRHLLRTHPTTTATRSTALPRMDLRPASNRTCRQVRRTSTFRCRRWTKTRGLNRWRHTFHHRSSIRPKPTLKAKRRRMAGSTMAGNSIRMAQTHMIRHNTTHMAFHRRRMECRITADNTVLMVIVMVTAKAWKAANRKCHCRISSCRKLMTRRCKPWPEKFSAARSRQDLECPDPGGRYHQDIPVLHRQGILMPLRQGILARHLRGIMAVQAGTPVIRAGIMQQGVNNHRRNSRCRTRWWRKWTIRKCKKWLAKSWRIPWRRRCWAKSQRQGCRPCLSASESERQTVTFDAYIIVDWWCMLWQHNVVVVERFVMTSLVRINSYCKLVWL